MRWNSVLQRALGVALAVITGIRVEEDGRRLVVSVRPRVKDANRCPVCRVACGRYDAGDGLRQWRTHDLGKMTAYVEAEAGRVDCAEHGVLVADVTWARPWSRFTTEFEHTVAWLAVRTD